MNFEFSIVKLTSEKHTFIFILAQLFCFNFVLFCYESCHQYLRIFNYFFLDSCCLFSSGDVRVNWTPTLKNGVTLKSGDVVSVSGMGRLKVIGKKTRKAAMIFLLKMIKSCMHCNLIAIVSSI